MGADTLSDLRRAQRGDRDASQRLVEENAGLIWSVVRRFFGRGVGAEDLYQIGCVGFILLRRVRLRVSCLRDTGRNPVGCYFTYFGSCIILSRTRFLAFCSAWGLLFSDKVLSYKC